MTITQRLSTINSERGAIMKKTIALFLSVLILLSFCSCSLSSNESNALDVIKTYVKALEENDTEKQQECMDPSVNAFSKGIVDSLGDLFGISGAYDMANGAMGLLGSVSEQALGIEIEYNFKDVISNNITENDGEITVKYELAVTNNETKEKAKQDVAWTFYMVQKDSQWYIQSYDEPQVVDVSSDEDIKGNASSDLALENTVGGKATEYIRSKSFYNGYAAVEIQLESESKYFKNTRWACIDTNGIIQYFFPEGYYHSEPDDFSFYNDVCVLYDGKGTSKFMSITGEELYTFSTSSAIELSDTGCVIIENEESTYQGDTKKCGLMDNKGNWIFELKEDFYLHDRGNGIFYITEYMDDGSVKEMSYDSKTGETYDGHIDVLYEGLYYGNKCFCDNDGNVVIDLSDYGSITSTTNFVNGRACVYSNGFTVIIDKSGNMVCEPIEGRYTDECYYNMKYSNCISIVSNETGKDCYYDLDGNLLFELNGLNIDIYSCGLLRESDGTYIDSTGAEIISSKVHY